MKPRHVAAAVLVAVIWGIAFVVSKIGLQEFSAPQLTALRFAIASLAVLWLPMPAAPWTTVVLIGLTSFAGQFLLQFFGMAMGMPAGLTAVVVQLQALFTVVLAALFLTDRPNAQQGFALVVALAGVLMIVATLGGGATVLAFTLTLASALSWALGNILIKRLPRTDMLSLMAWSSLVPPLPALAISMIVDGPMQFAAALASASWAGYAAAIYLGSLATVLGYAIWGRLLQQYHAGAVAPFALLAPCVGAFTSALVFHEAFEPLRMAGMAAILLGVAITIIPAGRWFRTA